MVRAASRGLLKGLGRVCGSLGAYRTLERKSKALVHVYGPWLNRELAANGDRGSASWPGAAAAARAAPRSQFPCLQCALGRGDVFEFFVDASVFKELRACRARTAGSAGRRHRAARAVLQASHGLPPALEPALVRRASCHQTCFFFCGFTAPARIRIPPADYRTQPAPGDSDLVSALPCRYTPPSRLL
jgi:hypothetical protein